MVVAPRPGGRVSRLRLVAAMAFVAPVLSGCASSSGGKPGPASPGSGEAGPHLLDAALTDEVPGATDTRYLVQAPRAHGYQRGQIVGFFAQPQEPRIACPWAWGWYRSPTPLRCL
jgi:hypothetical protein